MSGYFLMRTLRDDRERTWSMPLAMAVFLGVGLVKLFGLDLAGWGLDARCVFGTQYGWREIAVRALGFWFALAYFIIAFFAFLRRSDSRAARRFFGYGALALLFVYTSLELNTLLPMHLDEFSAGGVSVLWSLFAIGFVAGGIWKRLQVLRYLGLGLFAVVACKVAFLDLAHTPMIYRVLALIGVGVALMLGSFVYIYANRGFEREDGSEAG